jgi:hypothetical protein
MMVWPKAHRRLRIHQSWFTYYDIILVVLFFLEKFESKKIKIE